jgi:peptidoglycan-associated lipoprotein
MARRQVCLILASLIPCGGLGLLAGACATKSFVQEQVSATETKLTQRVDSETTQLRETSERAAAGREASADQRFKGLDQRVGGLDERVGQVSAAASDAKTRADLAGEAAHGAEARLSQRLAERNRYREVETRSLYFASDRASIRDDGIQALEDMASALKADANAVLELQGFADPRGSDRYNDELSRARVEAVIRYLVLRQGVELRQVRAVAMGKATLAAGEKASPEVFARTRRVDMRLLTPWSSWEDAQIQGTRLGAPQTGAATEPTIPEESALPREAATAVPNQSAAPKPPDAPGREPLVQSVTLEPRAGGGEAASKAIAPRPGQNPEEFTGGRADGALSTFLESVSPEDFGRRE